MPGSGWIRKWRGTKATQEPVNSLVRAAARGERLDQLLDLGARTLLAAGAADRAGLWLAGDRRGESGQGAVVESPPGPIPGQWKRLDVTTPFLRAALESPEPLRVEFGTSETISHLGPLVGMRSAIWIPLRTRNCTFGLAMVAYARSPGHTEMDALRMRADEIALAVRHHRDWLRSELASQELRAQLHLSRAILCGVSVDSILPQIARAARHHMQAEFIAVGRGGNPPVSGEGWDGPAEWASALHQGPLLELWHNTYDEGRESEIPGETIPGRIGPSSASMPFSAFGAAGQGLDRVIAIPIQARSRTCGVVMAGVLPGEDSTEDFAKLEAYALLAGSALDREFAREEQNAVQTSLRKLIEDSRECLVMIDEEGMVREANRAAAELLLLPGTAWNKTPIEDCFSPDAQEAVIQWRKGLVSNVSVPVTRVEKPPVSLEAAIHGGSIVRLHLRSEIEAPCGGPSRWVIHFENHGAEIALHDAQSRMEAEMAGLMDSIESGVLVTDGARNIRMASDRLGAILGFESRRLLELGTMDALIDKVAEHFTRPAETAARWREHVHRGEEASWDEFELTRPSRRIVERFARPLHKSDGTRVGWLEVFRDITGQRLIQSKLLQTEKMAALGQLVSGIAHELNNPLTSIQGYAQLLLSRGSPSERAGDAHREKSSAVLAGDQAGAARGQPE